MKAKCKKCNLEGCTVHINGICLKDWNKLEDILNKTKKDKNNLKIANTKLQKENLKLLKELVEINSKYEDIEKYVGNLIEENGEKYTSTEYKYIQLLKDIKEICNANDELKGDFNLIDCDKYKLGKHNLSVKIISKINTFYLDIKDI